MKPMGPRGINSMLLIGIVGGVASGKSTVADAFAALGAGVLNADRAGHEVLHEPEVKAALRERWGDAVFDADGSVQRPAIAKIVFAAAGNEEKQFLEAVSHPRIDKRLRNEAAELAQRGVPIAILDAALLYEAGWDKLCDRVLFVDASRELRLARALTRGWTEADFAAREARQWPVEEKRRRAGIVLDNSGTPAEMQRQVERLWRSWLPAGEA
jgi:dephospho-CoA kinase